MSPREPVSESGLFRQAQPSKEVLALQDVGRRMFLTQDPAEIVRLFTEAASAYTGARAVEVYLYTPTGELEGGRPELRPEPAVLDYVFEKNEPPVVPHGSGVIITVLPLRVGSHRIGAAVLDVTPLAEVVALMNLQPMLVLSAQAAAALSSAQIVSRSIGESALLSNILDSITNAIVTLDTEGRVTRVNRNAMAMLEIGGNAVGRPYGEALLPEIAAAVAEQIRETGEHGYAMEKRASARLPHGLELPVAVSCTLLQDESFASLGWIVVLRDMTASHELERLRTLDRMKSEFVANVSHELKTPLTSIKAYTEALQDMVSDEQPRSFLAVIDEESDRLLALINDLLNVSRIQAGKLKLKLEPCAPGTLIEQIMGISKVQSDRHELVVDIAPDLPEMRLDRERLKEVFINLVSNAVKYSPSGGRVTISMRLDGENLRTEVADQGLGIPKEHQDKIFQPFYRVDASNTAQIPGTGLGLVIAKAIVEHHGGRIWFESEPGRGTTFFVLIPIRRDRAEGTAAVRPQ